MNKELKSIKSKSFISAISLLGQSSYAAILGFIAFFILTLKSGVHLLGIYNTVLAMMAFFNYFTNLGLGAAIMQKKDVEEVDLSTAFYLQFILSILAVIIGFYLTPHLFSVYKDLPREAVYLYWAILASFFLLSLKTIPSILLEKRIEIYKVVFVQAVENTIFYLTVIIMVVMGHEIFSLVAAVLIRSVVGTIMVYFMYPWKPRFLFSKQAAKGLLAYGIPFQSNSFLALVKDDLLILYLGSAIGLTNLGYVTFGKKYAEFSIRLIMDNINRVAFPLFSRFQKEPQLLQKALHKVFYYETLLIFPIIIGALFIFDSVLKIVPGYFDKWSIALFSFYFFSLSSFFISLSTPFINLFNALGKVKLSVYFMLFWTAFIWITVPFGLRVFGFNGVSIAFFVMSLTFVFVYQTAKKQLQFSLISFIKENITASLVMALYLGLVRLLMITFLNNIYAHVILSVVGGAGVYFFVLYRLKGKLLYREFFDLVKLSQ